LSARGRQGRRLDAAAGQPQARDPQRDIDEEDAAPAELVDQHAAHQRACRAGDRHDRRPGRQHAVAHLLVVVGVGEQAQGTGHEQGRAQALQHAGQDEDVRVRRQPAKQGREGEDAQARQIDGLGAVAVGQRAGHQQQGRERQRIAVDDPDQVRQRNRELQRNAGEGHVDDGDVQHGHDEADRQRDER
jgi:hypothetical protein